MFHETGIYEKISEAKKRANFYKSVADSLRDVDTHRLPHNVRVLVSESIAYAHDKINNAALFIAFYSIDNPGTDTDRDSDRSGAKTRSRVKIVCAQCKNEHFDIENDTTYICVSCGKQSDVFNISPSHKDTSRINTTIRYTYKRRKHFKDCINQYQGKQNTKIDDVVVDTLRHRINMHDINTGDDYSRVTKEHISMFLKDSGFTKHYEDINLIYRLISGNALDDIAYLEDALMHDFNILTELYDTRFRRTQRISRKSFINTQYVLYQLLRRHKHPCRSTDFNILKTVDRRLLHEEIISELFNELGWNFTSMF